MSANRIREIVSLTAGILLGIIFLASGTGKLFGDLETPSQVMSFINDILPETLLTPSIIFFIYELLVPYLVPIAELTLGVFLVIGFVPRLAALLSVPLQLAFAATNIWAITKGGYSTCASCFGIWEKIFGHLTPVQSLSLDILMLIFALTVIFIPVGRFLVCRKPVIMLLNKRTDEKDVLPAMVIKPVKGLHPDILEAAQRNPLASAGYILGIAGIIIITLFAFQMLPSFNKSSVPAQKMFTITDNVTVAGITEYRAIINFTTAELEAVEVLAFDGSGKIIGIWSEDKPYTDHRIMLDNLIPANTYHFQLLYNDRMGGKGITAKYLFTTTEQPPAISNVKITGITENSVTVTWQTDRQTTTELIFRAGDGSEGQTITDTVLNTEHSIILQPLGSETDYVFTIKSIDVYGHQLATEYTAGFSLKTGTEIMQRAPDFILPSITGENITLSQFRGKAVFLVFWDVTCPVCRGKMPLLQEINNSLSSDNFVMLAIHGQGREQAIRSYLDGEKINIKVLLDSTGTTGYAYNVYGLPTTFLLDGAGLIKEKNPEFNNLQEFKALLGEIISAK